MALSGSHSLGNEQHPGGDDILVDHQYDRACHLCRILVFHDYLRNGKGSVPQGEISPGPSVFAYDPLGLDRLERSRL